MEEHQLYSLRARDVMNRNVLIISPLTTVQEAVERMIESHCQAAIVDRADEDDAYGILTFQEVAYRVIAHSLSPARTRVGDVMVKPLIVVNSNLRLPFVAQLLARVGIQNAIVIEEHKLAGIVSTADVARAVMMEKE